ncbi:LIM and SH3 domain protein F42H10.3 isoform X12 [Patella vulgata]|uniref:LIM and SH3 domain protein F42H10.3 isoform X12 n=1 Tax=Patella vulgata TaxID=6465 RepID=UPI0021808663|nr:LIM and SH3 domain protein F42H10.3 isoform X12 [Patella vulgata]
MNKICAKCQKTVYPTEELKCLDRSWHKLCFKCDTCGTTLNMKNYKGYNKRPYCNTHYPTTKFTPVAETPEMKRIAENTKIQSNVSYHADFEKLKGKKTSVVNDPETDRIRQNTAIQSNIQYQNIAAKKTDMEARRPEQVMDGRRGRINPGKISEYDPTIEPQPVSAPPEANFDMRNNSGVAYPQTGYQTAKVFDSQQGGDDIIESVPADGFQNGQRRQPGSISDYDPMTAYPQHYNPPQPAPPVFQGYTSSNINDRELFGDGMLPPPPPPAMDSGYGQQQPGRGSVHVPSYRAIYDYTAADDDEVSFSEGDLIIDCEVIDDGWMVGRVKRTGKHGMLPSNYVEKA